MADKFAIVTGASSGIGLALARIAAGEGYDLLIVADEPLIDDSAADLRRQGNDVRAVEADLATVNGVDTLLDAAGGRRVDVLCANAGTGRGGAFLDQEPAAWRHVVDTNITGTLYLMQRVLKDMVALNQGKVLVTGSIAGFIPGTFNAVYNGTKAFIDNIVPAIQNEIKDAEGVTLTNLMPGPVETEFFARADLLDTAVGANPNKSDPADVAKDGWEAMMAGKASIVSGWKNKLQVAASGITPQSVLAERHRKMAEPGSAD